MPSPYLATSLDAASARPSDPFTEAPTQRCAPPAFLLELSTPRPLPEEPTLRSAIPTILVDLPEPGSPHPLSDTATLRSPFFLDEDERDEPAPVLLDEALFSDSAKTRAFLAPSGGASTVRYGDRGASPAPLRDLATARYGDSHASPAPLPDLSTVRYAAYDDAPSPLRDSSTVRHAPGDPGAPGAPGAFDGVLEILDEDDAIREILDAPAAHHALPEASTTCFAIPISFATEFDDSDEYNDFEPVPTILDSIPTLAAPHPPGSPPRWSIGLSRDEGLDLVLAIPGVPPPDGPYALSLPLRQQMITALEARVGVSLDSPVRRDLLNEDLHLPIVAGAVRISLDLDDGEILFGAPLYHAWLAHERGLAARRHTPTRPGQLARTHQGQLT